LWTGNTRGANLSDAETHTTWHDEAMAEVIAVETELGLAPRGSQASVKARLDLYDQVIQAWASPIATGITIGNGTLTSSYYRLGKQIICRFDFIFGSSSSLTGDTQFTLPVGAVSARTITGTGWALDTSAATRYNVIPFNVSGTTLCLTRASVTSGTHETFSGALSATVPFGAAWATGDELVCNFSYLAA
jgi:hypothetical protein